MNRGTSAGSMQSGAQAGNNVIPKGYKSGQIQNFTPEMMDLFSQLFSHVCPESYLSRLAGGDQSMFEEIEAPAHRQFQEEIGGLASRFTQGGGGQGSMGERRGAMSARGGSGFANASTQAASDFAMRLQANRQGLQRQAIQDLRGFSTDLLGQNPYEQFLIKKQKKNPFWKQALGLVSPIAGDIASGDTHNTQNFLNALQGFM